MRELTDSEQDRFVSLLEQCQSPSLERREAAREALVQEVTEAHIPWLLIAAESPREAQGSTLRMALRLLGKVGHGKEEVAAFLAGMLEWSGRSGSYLDLATQSLAQLGEVSTPHLLSVLRSHDRLIRRRALWALGQCSLLQSTIDALLAHYRDVMHHDRWSIHGEHVQALEAVGSILGRQPDGVALSSFVDRYAPPLQGYYEGAKRRRVEALLDQHAGLLSQHALIEACLRSAGREAVRPFELAQDAHPALACGLFHNLARRSTPQAIETMWSLYQAHKNRNRQVSAHFRMALGQIKGIGCLAPLLDGIDHVHNDFEAQPKETVIHALLKTLKRLHRETRRDGSDDEGESQRLVLLRELLSQPTTALRWQGICALLESWPHSSRDMAIDYAHQHIEHLSTDQLGDFKHRWLRLLGNAGLQPRP